MNTQPNIQPNSEREININPAVVCNCKVSPGGLIEYANHQFCNISGYEEHELIGEPMEMLRHSDMPKVFFHIVLERLQKKEPIRIFSKFKAKDKRFFWLMVDFKTKVDEEGNIIAHYASSKPAPRYAVHKIEILHKILAKIEEKTGDTKDSRRYLVGFLEERQLNYNQFVEELSADHPEYEQPFNQERNLTQNIVAHPSQEVSTPKQQQYVNNIEFQKQFTPSKKERSFLKKIFGK